MKHILEDRKLTHAAARLLLVLQQIKSPMWIVRDTHEEIAQLCSMCHKSVLRLMKDLEYVGYAKKIYEPCPTERLRGATNVYVVYDNRP